MNLDRIEPLKALGISLISCDEHCAVFEIPLIGNRNDKGTLFAGSQYSGLVLCGWYLASHWASTKGLSERVAIKDSKTQFYHGALTDLVITARFDGEPDLRPSGHWRVRMLVEAVDQRDQVVSRLSGDYRILMD